MLSMGTISNEVPRHRNHQPLSKVVTPNTLLYVTAGEHNFKYAVCLLKLLRFRFNSLLINLSLF